MAKKKKASPALGLAIFLIVASLSAALVFGYLYFQGYQDLKDSTKELSRTKEQHDKLLSNVSELQTKLTNAEEKSRQLEASGQGSESESLKLLSQACDTDDCLLSSPTDKVFGLATVKAYYRKVEKTGVSGEDEVCPALVLVGGNEALLQKVREKVDSFCSIEVSDAGETLILYVNYGVLSAAEKNKIRASTAASPLTIKLFAYELSDGVGFEGEDIGSCLTPWTVMSVE